MIPLKTITGIKGFFRKRKRSCNGKTWLRALSPCFRIPGTLESDGLRLRPVRITDIPLIRNGLRRDDIMGAFAPGKSVLRSCLTVWWWLKQTYPVLYCIEIHSRCEGFIGLYDLKPADSAEVTLVIFDPDMRRHGHGSRAYALVTNLFRSSRIRKFIVEVKADNCPSISFWKKFGFEEVGSMSGVKTMVKGLEGNSL